MITIIEQRNHQSLNGGSHMKPYIIPNDKGCNYSNTVIAYDVSELGYENCIR